MPPKKKANEKAFNFSFTTSKEVEGEADASTPAPKSEIKKATPPTLAEVQAYATDQYPASADAQAEATAFVDHYASNGWRVSGKTQMVDWRAAFRNWMRRRPQFQAQAARAGGQPTPTRARTAPKSPDPTRWS